MTHPSDSPAETDQTILQSLPTQVVVIAWMYIVSAPVGFVVGVLDFVSSAQAGNWTFPIPIGVGMSAWAIGKGLLRGNRRAWLWARGLAAAGSTLVIVFFGMMLAFPGKAKFSIAGETHIVQEWDPAVMLCGVVMTMMSGWQFIVLRSKRVKELFPEKTSS